MNRRALIVTRFSDRSSFSSPRLFYFILNVSSRFGRCLKNKYDLFVQGSIRKNRRNRRKSRIARKRHVDTLNNRSASPILLLHLLLLPFSIISRFNYIPVIIGPINQKTDGSNQDESNVDRPILLYTGGNGYSRTDFPN